MAMRKSNPYAQVCAIFVFVKNDTKPSLFITEQTELTEYNSEIYPDAFDDTIDSIATIMKDPQYNLFIYKDNGYHYSFGMSMFENGTIYGQKEPMDEGEYLDNKVTTSKLHLIYDSDTFESHILIYQLLHLPTKTQEE